MLIYSEVMLLSFAVYWTFFSKYAVIQRVEV